VFVGIPWNAGRNGIECCKHWAPFWSVMPTRSGYRSISSMSCRLPSITIMPSLTHLHDLR
jgi:hypothetical protein